MEHVHGQEHQQDKVEEVPRVDEVRVGRQVDPVGDHLQQEVQGEDGEEEVVGVVVENAVGIVG